jgi:GAF domain-containing protein
VCNRAEGVFTEEEEALAQQLAQHAASILLRGLRYRRDQLHWNQALRVLSESLRITQAPIQVPMSRPLFLPFLRSGSRV